MTTRFSDTIHGWLGWCPQAPALRAVPAAPGIPFPESHHQEPDGSGPAGSSGGIRPGISIAVQSIRNVLSDPCLRGFALLFGLLMVFLYAAEYWSKGFWDSASRMMLAIPLGNYTLWFDIRLLVIQAACFFCFVCIMAGILLYRNGRCPDHPGTVREGLAAIRSCAGTLAMLSLILAFAATVLSGIMLGDGPDFYMYLITIFAVYFPFVSLLPQEAGFATWIFCIMLFSDALLLFATLYVVPSVVLEDKKLVPALAESLTLLRKTWREILGCALVYGTLLLMIGAVVFFIGQAPGLFNPGYGTPLSPDRAEIPVVCIIFFIAYGILLATTLAGAGVAVSDLYRAGKTRPDTGDAGGHRPVTALPRDHT